MLINVQFLRFFAAMLVVIYHSSSHLRTTGHELGSFFSWSEAVGFAGVDIFFVISGFIMAYTAGMAAGPRDSWAFFRRRCARIYSGYWPFFLLALLILSWVDPERIRSSSLIESAILWPANNLLIAVSWTLVFEMFFYLLFAMFIAFFDAKRNVVLKAMLGSIVCWSIYSQFVRKAYDPGQLEYMSLFEYYVLSPYLAEFLAGALLARLVEGKFLANAWVLPLIGVLLFMFGGWLNNHAFAGNIEQGYFVFYRVLVFGTASLLVVAGLVHLEGHAFRAPVRFSILAGGASYAIYLSHTLILTVTQYLGFNDWSARLSPAQARYSFIVLTILILLFCLFYYRWFEQPLHRVFKTVLGVGKSPDQKQAIASPS